MNGFHKKILAPVAVAAFVLTGMISVAQAQVEDTTRVQREGPERIETNRYNNIITIPYRTDIPESQIHHYRLNNFGSTYSFYRRLQYYSIEDFLFADDEEYNMYGLEWERDINERLTAILNATFQEENRLLRLLARLAPYMGLGFFERYEVPVVPRIEDGDRVYTED